MAMKVLRANRVSLAQEVHLAEMDPSDLRVCLEELDPVDLLETMVSPDSPAFQDLRGHLDHRARALDTMPQHWPPF